MKKNKIKEVAKNRTRRGGDDGAGGGRALFARTGRPAAADAAPAGRAERRLASRRRFAAGEPRPLSPAPPLMVSLGPKRLLISLSLFSLGSKNCKKNLSPQFDYHQNNHPILFMNSRDFVFGLFFFTENRFYKDS